MAARFTKKQYVDHLFRLHDGEFSEEDREQARALLESDPRFEEDAYLLEAMGDSLRREIEDVSDTISFPNFSASVMQRLEEADNKEKSLLQRLFALPVMKPAFSFGLVFLVATCAYIGLRSTTETNPVAEKSACAVENLQARNSEAEVFEIEGKGEQITVIWIHEKSLKTN